MPINRRDFIRLSGASALSLTLAARFPWGGAQAARANTLVSNEAQHILNRLTWGPRPVDVERIQQMGISAYIDWQLAPEAIPDPRIDDFVLNQQPLLSASAADMRAAADADYGTVYFAARYGRFYRAAYSERQLYELMVEFWSDHFNIPIDDLLVDKIIDDREVIRKHALGRFRDMLLASAQSPAMLMYLDNAWSYKEHPNENYAREIMELHTLGVDGGYTEDDVKALARILTGWSIREDWLNGFYFDAANHDTDEKQFLGQTFPAGRGIEEGLEALDLLATHPSTARFIAAKLCRRFVSDMPPADLVEEIAQVFSATDGDIRATMRALLTSQGFMQSAGQKYKRPIHYLVSILRTFDNAFETYDANWWIWSTESLGQVPWGWHPPNGYPDVAPAWISTSTLLERWNLGFYLPMASQDWFEGAHLDYSALLPPSSHAGELVDQATKRVLHSGLPTADRDALINLLTDGGGDRPLEDWERDTRIFTVFGLLFASPYFQWY